MSIKDFRSRINEVMHVTRRDVAALGRDDAQRIITTLQLRQLELEVQNESLRNALQQVKRQHGGESELFVHVPLGCVKLGPSGEITRANAAALGLLNGSPESLVGRTLGGFVVNEERWLFDELLREARQHMSAAAELSVRPFEAARRRMQFDIRALPDSDVEYIVMLSAAAEPQAPSVHPCWSDPVRRFESLGQLAAGIAHDFNNLLVSVMGNADLLSLTPGIAPEWSERLSLIMQASRQGSELTRQLLLLAAKSKVNATKLSLQPVIAEHVQQQRARLPPGVELHAQISTDVLPVVADAEQLGVMLRALFDNALEAMDGRGSITFQVRAQELTAADLDSFHHPSAASPGEFVVMQVRDSGPGIEPAALSSLFDPYFSTKPGHRGLGLAMALGIAQSHGGAMRVHTRRGGGARVEVALPTQRQGDGADEITSRRSHGEVLLIDDDDAVRKVVACLLELAGFEVTQAARGDVGLALYRSAASRYRLVVLDWVMPGCSGQQVLEELRGMAPRLPVVVISGYSSEDYEDCDPHLLRLAKPMTFHQLCDAIHTLTGIEGLPERMNA